MKKIIVNNIFFLNWNLFNLILVILNNIIISNIIFMSAFINYFSFLNIILKKFCFYFSRSKNKLWFKGFHSMNFQILKFFKIDCDMDLINIFILQIYKISCHTKYFFCCVNKII